MKTCKLAPAQQIFSDLVNNLGHVFPGDQFHEFAKIVAERLGDQEPAPAGLVLDLVGCVKEFIDSGYAPVFRGILYNSMADFIRIIVPGDVDYQNEAIECFNKVRAKAEAAASPE